MFSVSPPPPKKKTRTDILTDEEIDVHDEIPTSAVKTLWVFEGMWAT